MPKEASLLKRVEVFLRKKNLLDPESPLESLENKYCEYEWENMMNRLFCPFMLSERERIAEVLREKNFFRSKDS